MEHEEEVLKEHWEIIGTLIELNLELLNERDRLITKYFINKILTKNAKLLNKTFTEDFKLLIKLTNRNLKKLKSLEQIINM